MSTDLVLFMMLASRYLVNKTNNRCCNCLFCFCCSRDKNLTQIEPSDNEEGSIEAPEDGGKDDEDGPDEEMQRKTNAQVKRLEELRAKELSLEPFAEEGE